MDVKFVMLTIEEATYHSIGPQIGTFGNCKGGGDGG